MADEERVGRLEALVAELEKRVARHGPDHWPEGTDPVQVVNQVKFTSGAPTHEAAEGVICRVAPDGEAYMNNNGSAGWTVLDTGGAGAPKGASYLVLALNGDLTAERVMAAGLGLSANDTGPAGGSYSLSVAEADVVHAALSGGTATSAHHVKYSDSEARAAAAHVATVTFGWDPQSPQVFAP